MQGQNEGVMGGCNEGSKDTIHVPYQRRRRYATPRMHRTTSNQCILDDDRCIVQAVETLVARKVRYGGRQVV